jgi:hypothetical protein
MGILEAFSVCERDNIPTTNRAHDKCTKANQQGWTMTNKSLRS